MTQRRGLSRDQVLDAALDLADAEGLPAVSMRGVAVRLQVTPMALYRHVGDKDALLDGLVERLLGQVEIPPRDLPWEQRLERQARSLRAVAHLHPAAFGLLLARSATTGALRARDAALATLADAGVPADQVPRLERILSTFVLGFATSEVAGRFPDAGRAEEDFGYAIGLLRQLIAVAAGDQPPAADRAAGDQPRRCGGGAP